MRRMSQKDREFLASLYGPEVTSVEFADVVNELSVDETHGGGNGVEITRYVLRDGRTATCHSGLWETFFFITER